MAEVHAPVNGVVDTKPKTTMTPKATTIRKREAGGDAAAAAIDASKDATAGATSATADGATGAAVVAPYTVSVTVDDETIRGILADGKYFLRVGHPDLTNDADDYTLNLKRQLVSTIPPDPAVSIDEDTVKFTLNLESSGEPTYYMAWTQALQVGGHNSMEEIKLGQAYSVSEEGYGGLDANDDWVPPNAFGFSNEKIAAPILFRSTNGKPPKPFMQLPLWVPGSGLIKPKAAPPESHDLRIWFESREIPNVPDTYDDQSFLGTVAFDDDEHQLAFEYDALDVLHPFKRIEVITTAVLASGVGQGNPELEKKPSVTQSRRVNRSK